MTAQEPGTVAVRNILTRLCKRSGLSAERLRTTEIDISPLLELPVIRRRAHREGVLDPRLVVGPVIREHAEKLPPSTHFIVDAALSLGWWREHGAGEVDLDRLYAADLGERRVYLAENWARLHELAGATPEPAELTARHLRTSPEHRAFTELAALLHVDPGYGRSRSSASGLDSAVAAAAPARGEVVVLGDAVIDHIYRTDHLPGESSPARGGFTEKIGGKGLNRAVAAARLGFRTELIATVGDDHAGRRIGAYLHRHRVGVRHLKTVAGEPTPVGAVIVTVTGSFATIEHDADAVRLTVEDLCSAEVLDTLTGADAVFLTLEHSTSVLEHVLRTLRDAPRPRLFVHAGPPVPAPQYFYEFFDRIDYLVGSRRELAVLLAPGADFTGEGYDDQEVFDAEVIARLRALGVGCVCVVEHFRCLVRSARVRLDLGPALAVRVTDSPGAAAAFTAALAYRLAGHDWVAEPADFRWASAAMAAAQSFGDIPDAMPVVERIDRIAAAAAASQGDSDVTDASSASV
ncbi:MAG TPA: PfkB family carbohydrate kinase [Nocardia sp.]|uniref:carbohydrate kinase family protein n=1 Tax=Nocardia sp. TaxID=1821 RepID=UPI002B4AFFFF|nr:PfkB family carbohydrate kinase [Nocardia sp.]HLS79154.1 PfkB family carbohydrate kinase [Nocardia sp.]